MKKFVFALTALSLVASSGPTFAASQCRDKSGKFVKCPQAKAKAVPCRDAKGHYTKCAK